MPSVPVAQVKASKPARGEPMSDARAKPSPVWPTAGASELDARSGPAAAHVGNLPVRIGAAPAAGGRTGQFAGKVRVQVLDRAATAKAGVRGVLLRVERPAGSSTADTVDLTVEYGKFRTAYGADWASRLRLVALPECALTTPQRQECVGRPLPSRNDSRAGTVAAGVPVAGQTASALVSVQAAPAGPAGNYGATPLQPSATWSAGGNSGDFAWSYPMRVPPALGGSAPQAVLSYSSQSVDGRHAATNNQPSWAGEGFDAWPGGFIERRYELCADDMGGNANNTEKTGDQCWATDNASLSLAGHAGELIYNAAEGRWHLRSDDGTKIERRTNADNGDDDGEHWVVTTTDGVQYWFGLNKLPGAGSERTQSAWTVPVFGNNSGEPCHATAFSNSSCVQAYRWNLDYVVDLRANSTSYWYAKETNSYGRNKKSDDMVPYVRGGYLRHIAYGTRRVGDADSVFGGSAPARVVFGVGDRCLSTCGTHDEAHWPDTPWDQECTGSTCDVFSPTFWSTKRLATVTTQVWGGTDYRDVERWSLTHSFPDPGDGTRAGLWLAKISHDGLVGTDVSMPDVEFTGIQLANRVDTIDHSPAMNWWRLAMVRNETGGTINITYSAPDCVAGSRIPSAAHTNALRCYPVRW
ncbi:sugar-binding protein, partial [Actinoplanes sp. ATCC 53533]